MKTGTRNKIAAHIGKLEAMTAIIDEKMQAEQESFDGKSDKYREGDKGMWHYDRIQDLQNALDYLSSAIDALSDASQEWEG